MSQMAEATGGHAFYNTNGLTQAVATAINDGSNFYTLTYTPANPVRDGKFRKIKVQLAPQGVNLAYRHGYYADDPDKAPSPPNGQPQQAKVADSAVATASPTHLQTMRAAMMRGSPTPTEIIMKVAVFPVGPSTQTEDNPAAGNILSDKVHGPFRRYNVSYAIAPADITFLRAPDGKIQAAFELVIFVFNPEGVLVNRTSQQLHISSPLDELKKNVARGIQYNQEISAPAKGEYFFRIVVHDLPHDRIGAVEVATSERKKPAAPDRRAAPIASACLPFRNAGKQFNRPSIIPSVYKNPGSIESVQVQDRVLPSSLNPRKRSLLRGSLLVLVSLAAAILLSALPPDPRHSSPRLPHPRRRRWHCGYRPLHATALEPLPWRRSSAHLHGPHGPLHDSLPPPLPLRTLDLLFAITPTRRKQKTLESPHPPETSTDPCALTQRSAPPTPLSPPLSSLRSPPQFNHNKNQTPPPPPGGPKPPLSPTTPWKAATLAPKPTSAPQTTSLTSSRPQA